MRALSKWFRLMIREWFPAFVFFLIAFNLVVLTDALTTEQYGIRPFRVISAFVLALVVSKVILLTDFLPFVDAFRRKPLLCNCIWKTGLYAAFVLVLRYGERLTEAAMADGNLLGAGRHIIASIVWPRFLAVQIWLVVMVFIFVALREMNRRLGEQNLRQMFIGR